MIWLTEYIEAVKWWLTWTVWLEWVHGRIRWWKEAEFEEAMWVQLFLQTQKCKVYTSVWKKVEARVRAYWFVVVEEKVEVCNVQDILAVQGLKYVGLSDHMMFCVRCIWKVGDNKYSKRKGGKTVIVEKLWTRATLAEEFSVQRRIISVKLMEDGILKTTGRFTWEWHPNWGRKKTVVGSGHPKFNKKTARKM